MALFNQVRRSRLIQALIFLNVMVFLAWTVGGDESFMESNFLVSWAHLIDGRVWVLITSVFSHSMFLHLIINMMVLSNFGEILLRLLGPRFFLAFYFVAGILSSLTHALVSAFLLGQPDLPALGASGAISGLVMLFCLIFRREKIYLLGFIPMPALVGAAVFVGLDLWGLVAQAGGGGLPIGHGAHLGGAFTGAVTYLFIVRPRMRDSRELRNQPREWVEDELVGHVEGERVLPEPRE